MEYLFLRRRETISTSQRQKDLLFKAAEKHWKEEIVMRGRNNREIDCLIYKKLLLPVGNKDGVFGFGIILNKVECYD